MTNTEGQPPTPPSPTPATSTPSHTTRYPVTTVTLRWTLLLLSLGAAGLSSVLLAQTMVDGMALAGCGRGSPCGAVLGSPWSKILGVPVTIPAVGLYLAMAMMVGNLGPKRTLAQRKQAWLVLVTLSLIALISIGWFIIVQAFFIGSFCIWCMTTHAVGAAAALTAILAAPLGPTRLRHDEPPDALAIDWPTTGKLALIAILSVASFVSAQLVFPEPTHRVIAMNGPDHPGQPDQPSQQSTGTERTVRFDKTAINVGNYPLLGSIDATHVVVLFFDYTCPHCRALHEQLRQAVTRYDGQLAVALAPAPLSHHCNRYYDYSDPRHEEGCELAKLATAVWRSKPQAFDAYDAWLFEPQQPRTAAAARAKAAEILGSEAALRSALAEPFVDEFIKAQIEFNETLGRRVMVGDRPLGDRLPKLLLPPLQVVAGQPASASELFADLENSLGLQPPAQP